MTLRLALPSKGELEEPTLQFLASCGLEVERPSARLYTGAIPTLPQVTALFQRASDIPAKVEEGSAELGITGLDTVEEFRREDGELVTIFPDLGYSRCELVVAVPEGWIDVTDMADLVDLAVEMREKGRQLRVATKYPRLTQDFLFARGLNFFTLVEATGALEAAPIMGYADVIAELSASGATLRENRLKTLKEGTILGSQACLIGNRHRLRGPTREVARSLVGMVEARLNAGGYFQVTANVSAPSPKELARRLERWPELAGMRGPTICPVFTAQGQWFELTVVVKRAQIAEAVEHLRGAGAGEVFVSPYTYVFGGESAALRLLEAG